ncbi:MAG: leucine-rich repeat domain-containing protein, partial [Mycoplasma sp.]
MILDKDFHIFNISKDGVLTLNKEKERMWYENNKLEKTLYIPKEIDGVVVKIVDLKMRHNDFFRWIIFAEDSEVEIIEKCCFVGIFSVSKVVLPKTLKIIKDLAFSACCRIITMELPDGLEEIGYGCFSDCTNWEWNKKIPKGIKIIKEKTFEGCEKIEGELIIPDNVEILEDQCFWGISKINKITLGKNIKKIGWGVFSNCFIFNDLEIPSSVEYINEKAFRYIALVESKFINHSEFKNF